MALENAFIVDAVGIEKDTGFVVLTIADEMDWVDEGKHLLALQAKLNAYLDFIESGQVWERYPQADGQQLKIDVVGKFPIPKIATDLLKRAADASTDLNVSIRSRHYPGSGMDSGV